MVSQAQVRAGLTSCSLEAGQPIAPDFRPSVFGTLVGQDGVRPCGGEYSFSGPALSIAPKSPVCIKALESLCNADGPSTKIQKPLLREKEKAFFPGEDGRTLLVNVGDFQVLSSLLKSCWGCGWPCFYSFL